MVGIGPGEVLSHLQENRTPRYTAHFYEDVGLYTPG